MKFDIHFFKICLENSRLKNLTRIAGTLHGEQNTFLIISRSGLLKMRNVPDESSRENLNTRFMFDNVFLK
jgi:hypothetical protein